MSTPDFKQEVITDILSQPKKHKIGILEESSFLPVSDAVRRAMKLAKEALQRQGYDVVSFKVTEEEFMLSNKLLIGIVGTGFVPHMVRDLVDNGEYV